MRAQAGELDARLAAARHTSQSIDRSVTVTVTGRGALVDLRIADSALDGAHIRNLGISIVQAVRAARGVAHEASVPELSALFGSQPPPRSWSPLEPEPVRPEPTSSPRRRAADVAIHEESYEELDFLSDEDADGRR
ncbi:YbaB/EbfC family nucleoid-associated protein [Amycolatopsis japonica]|uniref:YbaB/EbfC family nucleoid-associated protein n=1 Tax=Amycolatopsis japonica TaxID=208439 RepID=UPI00331F0F03